MENLAFTERVRFRGWTRQSEPGGKPSRIHLRWQTR